VSPRIESVDARGDKWSATGVSPEGSPEISTDGKALAATAADTTTDVVIVIDNDRSLPNGNLQLSAGAAASILPGVGPVRRVGVVSTAKLGARTERSLSRDSAAVASAVDGVIADGDAATWDALTRAANMLSASDAPMKRVVAYLGAPDKLSTTSPGAAETALRVADARLDVMALAPGAPSSRLAEMVGVTGGSVQQLASDEEYASATEAELARLSSQYHVEFAAPGGDDPVVDLEFAVPGQNEPLTASAERSSINVGAFGLSVADTSRGLVAALMSNAAVRWLAILLLAASVIGFVWSVLNMVVPDANSLSSRLQVYEESEGPIEGEDGEAHGMMTVPMLQRAVDFTGEMAEKRGFLESIEVSLERASLPLRAAEAMFFVVSASVLVGVLATVLTGNLLVGLVAVGFGLMMPKAVLDTKVRRRQKKFVALLPDMLTLLAGTLKAGYSITQAFEAVSKEVEEPMGKELRRVVTEHRLGRTLEDALDSTAERMGSDDFAWTVMAIKIQREVGGNLAELLLTVSDTMTQRERLRRDVNSLTAEGRVSAFILGLLPPGLGVVMFVMNREYIVSLFTPGLGYFMIGAAVVAMIIGFVWMKKIITIEV
jgi:tight adherence protein B